MLECGIRKLRPTGCLFPLKPLTMTYTEEVITIRRREPSAAIILLKELESAVTKHRVGQYLKSVNREVSSKVYHPSVQEHLHRASINPVKSILGDIKSRNYTLRHVPSPAATVPTLASETTLASPTLIPESGSTPGPVAKSWWKVWPFW